MTYKNIIKHAIVRTAIGLTALLGGCDKDNDIPDVPIPTIPAELCQTWPVCCWAKQFLHRPVHYCNRPGAIS